MHMHEISWDNDEKTIIMQKFIGEVDSHGYLDIIYKNSKLMKSVTHTVDIILDITEAKINPKGFLAVSKHGSQLTPQNSGTVVIVGSNSFVQNTANLLGKITPKLVEDTHFVSTLEEAYEILKK